MTRTFDVPESIPLSKVNAFLVDLGIPPTHLREFHAGMDGVFVEIAATDEKGRPYVSPDGSLATHQIAIRLDRDA